MIDPRDALPWTYFGLFSSAKLRLVSELLSSLGARFYSDKVQETEERLKDWSAWDPSAEQPHQGHELWVCSEDLEKVGDRIVKMFPERKFGAA